MYQGKRGPEVCEKKPSKWYQPRSESEGNTQSCFPSPLSALPAQESQREHANASVLFLLLRGLALLLSLYCLLRVEFSPFARGGAAGLLPYPSFFLRVSRMKLPSSLPLFFSSSTQSESGQARTHSPCAPPLSLSLSLSLSLFLSLSRSLSLSRFLPSFLPPFLLSTRFRSALSFDRVMGEGELPLPSLSFSLSPTLPLSFSIAAGSRAHTLCVGTIANMIHSAMMVHRQHIHSKSVCVSPRFQHPNRPKTQKPSRNSASLVPVQAAHGQAIH